MNFCCSRGKRRRVKKYHRGSIYPVEEKEEEPLQIKDKEERITADFLDSFSREVNYCGFCKSPFSLGSNQLKIHCNICNRFFHCGIAGECIGKDCSILKSDGEKHRASYCIHCVSEIYGNNTCLCNDCHRVD